MEVGDDSDFFFSFLDVGAAEEYAVQNDNADRLADPVEMLSDDEIIGQDDRRDESYGESDSQPDTFDSDTE